MIKSIIISLFISVLILLLPLPVHADNQVTIHFFWASGCPHCAREKVFLDTLKAKFPQLIIQDYEITYNPAHLALLQKIGMELQADVSGVPFTVIGSEYIAGYYNDQTTGKEIETIVARTIGNGTLETPALAITPSQPAVEQVQNSPPATLQVPLIGELQIKDLSLPMLTFLVALLDGFNPCAMWVLIFLISLLLGMKDRKRMWILGITFIASSALVYFLFLSAWLNLFLFLGMVAGIRIIIGLVALFTGGYYLRDYWVNKEGSCTVMGNQKRRKIFERLRDITYQQKLSLALGGIVLLAIAVNMVELICSAGLPAIYTNVLSLSKLSTIQYYLYLAFYVLIFMLDDLFVFITAMITLQVVGAHSKYSRYSHLIGGILMLIIGLLLLFKPEFLMFG